MELKNCPVCGREGMPRCIFYEECEPRKRGLQGENICWLIPERCDLYKKKVGKITEKDPLPNPTSRRDFK